MKKIKKSWRNDVCIDLPTYLNKIQKKGRTKDELNSIINWLTGFDSKVMRSVN